MKREEVEKIAFINKETRISMNSVPRNTKKEFVEFAELEFENNYGSAFASVWREFKMWKLFVENMNYKLDEILEKVSQVEKEEKSSDKVIKTLSGREILKGGNK